MSAPNLGRLEKVDVRNIWTSEASDFTPWLAREDNLALIGEVIGIDLELEAQEKFVGPFRADILCKDTVTSAWVLIENQLERTDHTHLGQLLTYAAGLDAVTIVWIASRFADEHRAALDWLNTATAEGIDFFGLEIELWRIGDSAVAPKFNVVSKPNAWRETVSEGARRLEVGERTQTNQLQVEYWQAFGAYLEQHGSTLRASKAQPQHWMHFALGRSGFVLGAFIGTRDKWIQVALELQSTGAKAHFHLLLNQQAAIEGALGTPLDWRELPGKKMSVIALRKGAMAPDVREQWSEQHAWLMERLEAFHRVFGPRVRNLNAADYQPATPANELMSEELE